MSPYLDASSTKDVDRIRNVSYIGVCSKRVHGRRRCAADKYAHVRSGFEERLLLSFVIFFLIYLRWPKVCPWRSICLAKASAFLCEDLSLRHKVWQIADPWAPLPGNLRDVPREWQMTRRQRMVLLKVLFLSITTRKALCIPERARERSNKSRYGANPV